MEDTDKKHIFAHISSVKEIGISTMEQTDVAAFLDNNGVKPTANRILVLKSLRASVGPVNLSSLEDKMETMDKSSIFRVLTLFLEHDIVHVFEDGRGVLNYELCTSVGKCNHNDAHVHFYCESCHQSFCMEELHIPDFKLPIGFTSHSASFVIKGECPQCRKKQL